MNYSRVLAYCSSPTVRYVLFYNTFKRFNDNIILVRELNVNAARIMAQSRITSFFQVPPKKAVKNENNDGGKSDESKTDTEQSPAKNAKDKASAKRARISSGSEAEQSSSPEDKIEKKNKVKRPRIESSESETEQKKTPIKKRKIVLKSPVKSPEKSEKLSPLNQIILKVAPPNAENAPKINPNKFPLSSEKETTLIIITPKGKKLITPKKEIKSEQSNNADDKSPKKENIKIKIEKVIKETDAPNVVPELQYNPASTKYHPVQDACWQEGEPVPYMALARTLEQIEETSARLRIVDTLANYFRSVIALTPQDLLPSVYMCLNKLAPAYHSLELGVAETYLMKAIGASTGRSVAQVKTAAAAAGDLGTAAAQCRATQRTMFAAPKLMLRNVFSQLKIIAKMTGHAVMKKKISKIQSLYVACRHCEAKFLIRSLEGKLRIGLAEQSVLQALSQAVAMTPPPVNGEEIVLDASKGMPPDVFKARVDEHALIIKTTYCECPNYELLIPALLRHGVSLLQQHCRLTVGIPLKPMLAHPTKGVHEVFNRFEGTQFTCEWKYDGERAQIHLPYNEAADKPDFNNAAIFSRNQENNTTKYPDVLRRLRSLVKESVNSCVLDCEAVAYDTQAKQILPFQVLSTRKRKDAVESEIRVRVCVFVFDVLFLNGRPLVREPLHVRRSLLRDYFNEVPGEWQFATSKDCSDMEEVQQFLEESVRGSCEGLMVKALFGDQARYDIARRSHNWLKLKKDYLDGVGDTIDVVIIGAYRGKGKRHATYGGFLAAARDPDCDRYQALCKLGTGFTDDDLATLTQQLSASVIDGPRNYYDVDPRHAPDVWLSATHVWEVRCADLSLSPAHRAAIGLVDPERGISLRFPRFIRVREDKTPEQATSSQQIAEMYLAQDQVKNNTNKPKLNIDDFY